jgi:hypothetical protein
MAIATKNGSLIVKEGKLTENCACCANCNAELLAKATASNLSLNLEISIQTNDETWSETGEFIIDGFAAGQQTVSVGRTFKLPAQNVAFSRTIGNGFVFSGNGPTSVVWSQSYFSTNLIESNACSGPNSAACVKRSVEVTLTCRPDQSINANVLVRTHSEQKWNIKTTTEPQNVTFNRGSYTEEYSFSPAQEFEVTAPMATFAVSGILGSDLGTISGGQSFLAGRYPAASLCPGCNSNLPPVFSANVFVHGSSSVVRTPPQPRLGDLPPHYSLSGFPIFFGVFGRILTEDPIRSVPYDMSASLSWA